MKIIAVDDEALLLKDFVQQLETVDEIDEIHSFTDEMDAVEYVKETKVDVAMLDVQMPGMGGLLLAEKLSEIQSDINIIFVTGYDEYGLEAMKLHASGYLLKQPTTEEIVQELHKLRYPIRKKQEPKRICVNTFGNFDVYVDGKIMIFDRRQAKEMLAYLIHKEGQSVSRRELASILFEDEMYDRRIQKQLQNIIGDLKSVLRRYSAEQMLLQERNSYAIDKEQMDCDLYDFLEEDSMQKIFMGMYMENYSWAEEMKGLLTCM